MNILSKTNGKISTNAKGICSISFKKDVSETANLAKKENVTVTVLENGSILIERVKKC